MNHTIYNMNKLYNKQYEYTCMNNLCNMQYE